MVKMVLCEPAQDIFDGLVVASPAGDRYVSAEDVAVIHERGVDLAISCTEVAASPRPHSARRIKWDLDQPPARLWEEIENWLRAHLPPHHTARDAPLSHAQARLAARSRALKLARDNPELAMEAGIGRPDLPGADHGYVVDINHAALGVIGTLPGLDERLARQIAEARDRISGFASLEELGMVVDLTGDEVERLRGHVVFLPN
ncbi:MAG: helix-hairpin-helix domain-containing protein [Solirubrobacterales bacterium]|nr:helix-hairpin-helix domain-containing protein [Solirubrobacterales bacterium]